MEKKRRRFRQDKPTIYWTYYPGLRRGYWRVSPRPLLKDHPYAKLVEHLWASAHDTVHKMNAAIGVPA